MQKQKELDNRINEVRKSLDHLKTVEMEEAGLQNSQDMIMIVTEEIQWREEYLKELLVERDNMK